MREQDTIGKPKKTDFNGCTPPPPVLFDSGWSTYNNYFSPQTWNLAFVDNHSVALTKFTSNYLFLDPMSIIKIEYPIFSPWMDYKHFVDIYTIFAGVHLNPYAFLNTKHITIPPCFWLLTLWEHLIYHFVWLWYASLCHKVPKGVYYPTIPTCLHNSME